MPYHNTKFSLLVHDRRIRERIFITYFFFSNGRPKLWTCSEGCLAFFCFLWEQPPWRHDRLLGCLKDLLLVTASLVGRESLTESYLTDRGLLFQHCVPRTCAYVRCGFQRSSWLSLQLQQEPVWLLVTGVAVDEMRQYKANLAGVRFACCCLCDTGTHTHRHPRVLSQCRNVVWGNAATFHWWPAAVSVGLSGALGVPACLSDTFPFLCPSWVGHLCLEYQEFRL